MTEIEQQNREASIAIVTPEEMKHLLAYVPESVERRTRPVWDEARREQHRLAAKQMRLEEAE